LGLNQSIGLLGRVIVDSNRLGFDAVAEHFGGALPLYPASVVKPAKLNELLREHGTDLSAGAEVGSVELLDIKSISSNCNNSVVRVATSATSIATSHRACRSECRSLTWWRTRGHVSSWFSKISTRTETYSFSPIRT
jgi:hypothetical protein